MSIRPHPTKDKNRKPGELPWWYIVISHGRKEAQENILYQGTEAEAKAFDAELQGKSSGSGTNLKVIDKLSAFLTWHKTNRAERTHQECNRAFKILLPYLGHKYIAYLRKSDYEPYKAARLATKIIPKQRQGENKKDYEARKTRDTRTVCRRTVQIELNHFRTFLRWCAEEEKLKVGEFPTGYTKKQQQPKGKVLLSMQEMTALLENQKRPAQNLITRLMLQCGLRRSEALNLKRKNIDLGNGVMIITGKGNKTRIVPIITPEILENLKNQCKDKHQEDWLFVNPATNKPYRDIKKSLKTAAQKAGIGKRVYNHLMRHNFITTAIVAGVPVSAVAIMAGHEDIRTTDDYTHLAADYLKSEAVKIASVMSGMTTAHETKNDKP